MVSPSGVFVERADESWGYAELSCTTGPEVTVHITGINSANSQWRIRGRGSDTKVYLEDRGLGYFYFNAINNKDYVFQIQNWNGNWVNTSNSSNQGEFSIFTVTFDSGGDDGGDDGGGGDSGGDYTEPFTFRVFRGKGTKVIIKKWLEESDSFFDVTLTVDSYDSSGTWYKFDVYNGDFFNIDAEPLPGYKINTYNFVEYGVTYILNYKPSGLHYYQNDAGWGFSASDNVDPYIYATATKIDSGDDGGSSEDSYLIILNDGGYTWDNFPTETLIEKFIDEALILPQLYKSPTPLSKVDFKIKGNANGGVEDTYINASKQNIKAYNFTGWTDDLGTKWYDSFTDNRHADLFAGQEEIETIECFNNTLASLPKPTKDNDIIKYNITYDARGGIASKTEETIEQNIEYYFDYWSSDKSGNGEHYTDSSSFTEETEVFAIWGKQQDITSSVVLPTATKNGYKLSGWTAEDQSLLLPAGAVVNINKDMNFHAVWESGGRIFIHDGTTWVVII